MMDNSDSSVRRLFYCLGRNIGNYPVQWLTASLLLTTAASAGLVLHMRIANDIRDDYTPLDAEARRELATAMRYLELPGVMYAGAMVLAARDAGSLLRPDHLRAVVDATHYVNEVYAVTTPHYANFTYAAGAKSALHWLSLPAHIEDIIDMQRRSIAESNATDPSIVIDYPIASVGGNRLPLLYNLRDVVVNESRQATGLIPGYYTGNLQSAGTIFLIFEAGSENASMADAFAKWEYGLYERCTSPDGLHPLLRCYLYGDKTINVIVTDNSQRIGGLVAAGALCMQLFITVSMLCDARAHGVARPSLLWLSTATTLSPTLACTAVFGLLCYTGGAINSLLFVSPLLVVGIGVDDAFLLMHAWFRHIAAWSSPASHTRPPSGADRFATVAADVGPSMAITSMTNALALTVGYFTPMRAISTFSGVTALAILLDFVMELCFFGAATVLVLGEAHATGRQESDAAVDDHSAVADGEKVPLDCGCETTAASPQSSSPTSHALSSSCDKLELRQSWPDRLVHTYCSWLVRTETRLALLALLAALWVVAANGFFRMESNFKVQTTFARTSPLAGTAQLVDSLMDNITCMDFMVLSPPDISNSTQLQQYRSMIHELETLPSYGLGPDYTCDWLDDYIAYYRRSLAIDSWFDFGYDTEEQEEHLDFSLLIDFLEDKPFYKHNVKYRLSADGTITVTGMRQAFCITGAGRWPVRARVHAERRRTLSKYGQFAGNFGDYESAIYDLIMAVPGVMWRTMSVTLLSMALVCAAFVPNAVCVLASLFAIASTVYIVLGALYYTGADIDPVCMIITTLCVGFTVDYTAHVVYHIHGICQTQQRSPADHATVRSRQHALVHSALCSVGLPMVQAAGSTALSVAALSASAIFIYETFCTAVVCTAVVGLLHGLVVLPSWLSALPPSVLAARHFVPCRKKKRQSRNEDKGSTVQKRNSYVVIRTA